MKLKIVTPERIVFEDNVESVYAKTLDGEIGILPKHIPMVAPLDISVLRYVKEGKKEPVAIMGGLIRTDGETVSVLCNAAELVEEIDIVRAEESKKRAESYLQEEKAEIDINRAKLALNRSLVRIKTKQFS